MAMKTQLFAMKDLQWLEVISMHDDYSDSVKFAGWLIRPVHCAYTKAFLTNYSLLESVVIFLAR